MGGDLAGVEFWVVQSKFKRARLNAFVDDFGEIAWSPDGRYFGAVTNRRTSLWDASNLRPLQDILIDQNHCLAWSPDSTRFAMASGGLAESDQTVRLHAIKRPAAPIRDAPSRRRHTYSLAWSANGQLLAVGGTGDAISILDAHTLETRHVLEGAFHLVEYIQFSPDGTLLAARVHDGSVHLWRTGDWNQIGTIGGTSANQWTGSLAFHPEQPILATLDKKDTMIRLWQLDATLLSESLPSPSSVQYQNAKVLLVGDTGVGKSGLAQALTGHKFAATESTHGRRVLTLDNSQTQHETIIVTRETLLWDLAGQPGYRLVHQLHMDDAAMALVLFDARSETDPFGGAAYWARALAHAKGNTRVPAFLVAARSDRGGVSVSDRRIQDFVKAHGFDGVFSTSAKTGQGVTELAAALRTAISWNTLPIVSSTVLFTDIRAFVRRAVADPKADRLLTMAELCAAYQASADSAVEQEEFEACIRRLEANDVVDILVFSALDDQAKPTDYVLLEPSFVDAYASAIVIAAKDEPDGIGHLRESDVLQCRFAMERGERLQDPDDERLILVATVERFLKHELALRERIAGEDYLVFPSQYTRDAPFPGSESYGISYDFAGPVRSIFTTLVVRLAHSTEYSSRDFWRNAACYESIHGGRCVALFEDKEDGYGRTTIFFEDSPPETVQRTFLEYVFNHLKDKATLGSVKRRRAYHCPTCDYVMDDRIVEDRLKEGRRNILCPRCETRSPLYDLLFEDAPIPEDVSRHVRQIDEDARIAKTKELAVTALQGKIETGEYDVFMSYNGDDRPRILEIANSLKAIGLRPWLDVWDLIPGRPWQEELEKAITQVKSAAIFVGKSGVGPWEDREMRAFIQEFVSRSARVIPVLLSGLKQTPKLPVFLREFTWVDLRGAKTSDTDALRYLVAGIIDRRPDDDVWKALAVLLVPNPTRPATTQMAPNIITLRVAQSSTLSPLDVEAIRAQLAESLGVADAGVQLVELTAGTLRIGFDRVDDVVRLIKLVQHRDPNLLEKLERWRADPELLLEDNRDIVTLVRERERPRTGDDGTATARRQPDRSAAVVATMVDVRKALPALGAALAWTTLPEPARGAVERALAYATQEAAADSPDRAMIAAAVRKSVSAVAGEKRLTEAADGIACAITAWCER